MPRKYESDPIDKLNGIASNGIISTVDNIIAALADMFYSMVSVGIGIICAVGNIFS